MTTRFFITNNGKLTGNISEFHSNQDKADADCATRNARAEHLGLSTRYTVASVDEDELRNLKLNAQFRD